MQNLAERLDNIRIRVRAPGTEIEAELSRRTDIELFFEDGAYAFADEPMLEQALTSIAELLWAGWRQQYRRAIEYANLIVDAVDSTDIDFFAERDKTEAAGASSDHRITISTIGMRNFSVHIAPGTIREITESQFGGSVAEAAALLIQDYQAKVRELKQRYYNSTESRFDTIAGFMEANSTRPEAEHQQQTLCDDTDKPRSSGFHERAW
ncbi:hypothetical protein [Nocardia terpenica]|uniref:hypothetical protein n=1 Tax=Nocardia terpenica TaxID=455432 RepID=UPI0003143E1D|nr:hypothetical protein [Nocardia terpenica]